MSNQVQLKEIEAPSNPFCPLTVDKPVPTVTTFDKDEDKFIIEYGEVERVEITGPTDKDFIIHKEVIETNRVNRRDYIQSYESDTGILNILQKVRLSGDMTLLNQTGRVGVPGVEKDALGRPVEDIGDYTAYQVDRIDALEAYKKGRASFTQLPEDLKKNLSFEAMAKMSDDEIIKYLDGVKAAIISKQEEAKKGSE